MDYCLTLVGVHGKGPAGAVIYDRDSELGEDAFDFGSPPSVGDDIKNWLLVKTRKVQLYMRIGPKPPM